MKSFLELLGVIIAFLLKSLIGIVAMAALLVVNMVFSGLVGVFAGWLLDLIFLIRWRVCVPLWAARPAASGFSVLWPAWFADCLNFTFVSTMFTKNRHKLNPRFF